MKNMWHIPTLKIEKRININADCITVFNYEERNLIDHLTHENKDTYKHFPKHQVVGVWMIKHEKA